MGDTSVDRIKIVVVDDDPAFLDRIETGLTHHSDSFSIQMATSFEQAIPVIKDTPADCVLSTNTLDSTTGLELLRTVRTHNLDIPFFLLTRADSTDLETESIRAGVTEYLHIDTKTLQYSVLSNRIQHAVETYQAEKRITELERRYELATRASTDAFFTYNVSTETLQLETGFEEFGYHQTQVTTGLEWWLERVHPDDRETIRDQTDAMLACDPAIFETLEDDHGYVSEQCRWQRQDGSYIDCLWRGRLVLEGNTPTVMVGAITDISERKDREQVLTALNNVAVDLDTYETVEGICKRSIDASKELLQFDLSVIDIEEDGMLSKAAISEDIPEVHAITMPVDEGIAGKTYRTGDSILVDDISAHPEAKPEGPYHSAISIPIGSHGVFQAVSEDPNAFDKTDLELGELLISHTTSALDRLEREQQLRHQNNRLEEFTRIVSHDLRNPLNVAEGHLQLAQENYDSHSLTEAEQALSRMKSIVDETLTLARNGQLVDKLTDVCLDELSRECWHTVDTEAATLEIQTEKPLRCDPSRVRHILENLFRNAIEHGGSAVTVRVGEVTTADKSGFYVEDTGEGLPNDQREMFFESGYTGSDGTGFGLTIVQQIADAHGWTVRVTERTSGGARFEFSGVTWASSA